MQNAAQLASLEKKKVELERGSKAGIERIHEDGTRSEIIAIEREILVLDQDSDDEDEPYVVAPVVRLFTGSSARLGLYEPNAYHRTFHP